MSSPLVLIKFIMKKILTGFSLGLLLFVGAGQAMAQTAEVTATSKLPFLLHSEWAQKVIPLERFRRF